MSTTWTAWHQQYSGEPWQARVQGNDFALVWTEVWRLAADEPAGCWLVLEDGRDPNETEGSAR